MVPLKYLHRSKYNIVVHGSDLPRGRGMSPISWQILNNKKNITFSLIEANESIDNGKIYYKKKINIKKDTLFDEIKNIQFDASINLIKKFLKYLKKNKKPPKSVEQVGTPSYYRKRTPADGRLSINKNLKSQFNLLRIADNKNYPSFFKIYNKTYVLKVIKKNS